MGAADETSDVDVGRVVDEGGWEDEGGSDDVGTTVELVFTGDADGDVIGGTDDDSILEEELSTSEELVGTAEDEETPVLSMLLRF